MDNVILFPSYKVGIRPEEKIAFVANAENGRGLSLKTSENQKEIPVFAQSDFVINLKQGDWVRFDDTKYGALILEKLAQPGTKPMPRIKFKNGLALVNLDDPAWRLYEKTINN